MICSASSRDRGPGIATRSPPLLLVVVGRRHGWNSRYLAYRFLRWLLLYLYTFCLFSFKKLTLGSVSGMVDLLNILREGWNEDAVEGFFLLLSGIDSLSYWGLLSNVKSGVSFYSVCWACLCRFQGEWSEVNQTSMNMLDGKKFRKLLLSSFSIKNISTECWVKLRKLRKPALFNVRPSFQ